MSEQEFDLQPLAEPKPSEPLGAAPAGVDLQPLTEPKQSEPVSLTAYKAAHGLTPEVAAKALQVSKQTGVSPQFAADNWQEMQLATERSGFESALVGSPVLAAYAGESALHGSMIKDDVAPLTALVMGLSDVGYAIQASRWMSDPSSVDEATLRAYEQATQEYAAKEPGFAAEVARALPNVAAFGAAGVLGAKAGPFGGMAATASMLHQLERGVLYRRILNQAPVLTADERALNASLEGKDTSDEQYTAWTKERQDFEAMAKDRADKFSAGGAVLGAAFGDAFTRALPGANAALKKIGQDIAAKAATRTLAESVVKRGTEYVGHTMSGMAMMGVQAVTDDMAVQEATTGKIDYGRAVEAGAQAMYQGFGVAAVLSAYTPARELLRDRGRIADAPREVARLDELVEQAKASKLAQRSPVEFGGLVQQMAANGETQAVYVNGDAAAADRAVAGRMVEALADDGQALAEAQATGGDVAVPIDKYLTVMKDDHEALREDVKLTPDGMTLRQANEATEALKEAKAAGETTQLRALLARLGEPGGGFTYDTKSGAQPIEGYALSIHPERSVVIDAEKIGLKDLALFAAKNRDLLSQEGNHFGAWHEPETGKVYLDVSTVTDDQQLAEGLARLHEQKAYFDLKGGQSVSVEKAAAAPTGALGLTGEPAGTARPAVREAHGQEAGAAGAAGGAGGAEVRSISERDAASWARQLIEEKTIKELNRERYDQAARNASDRLAKVATASARKGQEAAQQAFVGAGTQTLEAAAPEAGVENLSAAGRKAGVAARQLADVPRLERARDLSRAMAKVADDVKAEMERGRDYINKRDTDSYRAGLRKASPAYLDAHNALMDAIDDNTPKAKARPGVLDDLFDRMDQDNEQVGAWGDKLQQIVDESKGWKNLTPPEARTVLAAMKSIRSAAMRVDEVELADRKQGLRDLVTGVRDHLDALKRPETGLPAPSRASEGMIEKKVRQIGELGTEALQPREILRRLGLDAVMDDFTKRRNVKEALARETGDYFYKAFEQDMPKDVKKIRFDAVKGPDPNSTVFNNDLWTRQDLWEFASWWGSESGADRIKRGLGIGDKQAHDFMAQLTHPEIDFVEAKARFNDDKLWPLIRDYLLKKTGAAPPKIEGRPFTIRTAEGDMREVHGGYEPARYIADRSVSVAPENAQSISEYWGSMLDSFDSTAKYFTKERAQNVARVPDLNWSNYPGHVGAVLQFLAYDPFVTSVGRIFRDPEFRQLVQQREGLGPQAMTELDKFLGTAARGQVEVAQGGAQKWNAMLGNGLRGRLAVGAFQLNPRVTAAQLTHPFVTASAFGIGPADMLHGFMQAMQPGKWGTDFENLSEQLPYRKNGFGMHMREQLQNIGPTDPPLTRKWLNAAGWALNHWMDNFNSKWIYEMAGSKAEKAGADPVEAAKYADNVLATAMPPLNLAEQSSLARDRGTMGALVLVRGYPNTLFNMASMLKWNAENKVLAADPGWSKMMTTFGAYGLAGIQYLGMAYSAGMAGHFILGRGRQPDESWSEWAATEALAAPLWPVAIAGDIARPVAEAIATRKTLKNIVRQQGIFSAAPALGEIEQGIRSIGAAMDSASPDEDRVFAGLRLTLNALRVGPEMLKGIQYGYDLGTGRYEPRGPFDVLSGFGYGKRRGGRQPRNPFSTAQDFLSGE